MWQLLIELPVKADCKVTDEFTKVMLISLVKANNLI